MTCWPTSAPGPAHPAARGRPTPWPGKPTQQTLADSESKVQHSFTYSDGFGREIQKKIQAEPGPVPAATPPGDHHRRRRATADDRDRRQPAVGRQRLDHLQQQGQAGPAVRAVLHRHPPLRVRRRRSASARCCSTTRSGGSSRPCTPTTPTRRSSSTPGSRRPATSTTPSPRTAPTGTPHRSGHRRLRRATIFARCRPTDQPGRPGTRSARTAALGARGAGRRDQGRGPRRHARPSPTSTPSAAPSSPSPTTGYVQRPRADPRDEESIRTRVELDIEGNQRAVRDAIDAGRRRLGRVVMRYDYDMLGNRIHQASMEAGERWMLSDVAGKPIRAWDSRGHTIRTEYDPLRRPIRRPCHRRRPAHARPRNCSIERLVYGEQHARTTRAANLRGKASACTSTRPASSPTRGYDFKGNLLTHPGAAYEYKGHRLGRGRCRAATEHDQRSTPPPGCHLAPRSKPTPSPAAPPTTRSTARSS